MRGQAQAAEVSLMGVSHTALRCFGDTRSALIWATGTRTGERIDKRSRCGKKLLTMQVVIVRVPLKAKSEAKAEHVVDVDLGKLSVEHRLIDDA